MRADRRLMREQEGRRSARLDALLIGASRAADHSMLWLVISAMLALGGGKRGRRAASNGLLGLGIASASANGPLKGLVHRGRPPRRRVPLVRQPRTFSFPSGHSASAFAFGVGASRQIPALAPGLLALAGTVAYSRVYVGVHYPSDVVLGGALGAAAGLIAGPMSRKLRRALPPPLSAGPVPDLPTEAILVTSPHAGASSGLQRGREAIQRVGLSVVEELQIQEIERLAQLTRSADGGARLIVAAGGDGTVGAVADALAHSDSVLGVLPLGTSNDFARSLGIPIHPERAVALFTAGKIATIDLGRLIAEGQPPKHFVHAATVGLNVNFARLATRASMRDHLGRFTYVVAAMMVARKRPHFDCELHHDGHTEHLRLSQLSVINAPTFGGALGLRFGGSNLDDRMLDILAVEDLPLHRIMLAALVLVLHIKRAVPGVRAMHLSSLHVHTGQPLDVALDGEVIGTLPGDFQVAGEALRVITPLDFEDIDE